jgi:hypothetical protein
MKRRISMVMLVAIATLNMGQSCRQDAWSTLTATFWSQFASVLGTAAGNGFVDTVQE